VHAIVDGGVKENTGSSILDCADGEIKLVRKGAGAEILAQLGLEE
jgi:tRNA A37 threonylcarbamoyladenosine synthetase subunit TsaC/SUA5/YrdC